jgi:hypothetical protein
VITLIRHMKRILDMSEVNTDPFGMAKISKDFFAAQQKFSPLAKSFEQFSEVAQIISAAQMAYGKELMRANQVLFGGFMNGTALADSEIRPSISAKKPERAA